MTLTVCSACGHPIPGSSKEARSFAAGCTGMLALELLLVLGFVGTAVMLFPGGFVSDRVETAKANMKANIVSAVKQYAIKNGTLPTTVGQLLAPPAGQGSLTLDAIIDPWNHEYKLTYFSQDLDHPVFAVICWGPIDGKPIVVKSE
jgi:hypothetical protein